MPFTEDSRTRESNLSGEQFRHELMQEFCPSPATSVTGHLVNCDLLKGHSGECRPRPGWKRDHNCEQFGCRMVR